jgi:hypothetical protein
MENQNVLQNRVEVLRDLIVSKKSGVATGVAMEYVDELQRPLEDLEEERAELLQSIHGESHALAADEAAERAFRDAAAVREAVRELVDTHSYAQLVELREEARLEREEIKDKYRKLSAALAYLETEKRFEKQLAELNPEEREAFLEFMKKH